MPDTEAIYVADFETTSYDGIQRTDVWLWSICNIFDYECELGGDIESFWNRCLLLPTKSKIYFHNLKFDGTFLLTYLNKIAYKQAFHYGATNIDGFYKDSWMDNHTYKYSISGMGLWYSITVKVNRQKILYFYDSYKLIPFSAASMAEKFGLEESKGSIDYTKFRYPNCEVSEQEKEYVKGDVIIVAKCLNKMISEGHDRLTIGSCCMKEFKQDIKVNGIVYNGKQLFEGKFIYSEIFPNLYEIPFKDNKFGSASAGEYIRKSYKGAWTYLKSGCENKVLRNGMTLDVNSLYPSEMESESGNKYPIGKPFFYTGKPKEQFLHNDKLYLFIRLRTRFKLKKDKLPFIQIKNTFYYKGNEHLVTSDWKGLDGKYYSTVPDENGNEVTLIPELTLTETDYYLFLDHYDLYETEYLDYCIFAATMGVFDSYIHKYKDLKQNAKTNGDRTISKLYSNNLYGKLATNTDSSFKVIEYTPDGAIQYRTIQEDKKTPGYIPCGSAITSYARNFIIRAAQKNYKYLAYTDTDSLHLYNCTEEDLTGVTIDSKAYSCFKIETKWDYAIFARQKTYIEHVIMEDGEEVEPYFLIKCAGMGKDSKKLINYALQGKKGKDIPAELPKSYHDFLDRGFQLTDFKPGLKVPGTLRPRRIPGGTVLMNETFEMLGDSMKDVKKLIERWMHGKSTKSED